MACLAGCRLQYPAAAVIHTGVQLSVSDRFWHAPIRGKGGTGSGGRLGQGPPTCRTRRTHVVGNRLASGLPPTQQKDVRHGLKLLTLKPGCVCRTCTAQWEGSVFPHGAVPAAWQLRNDSSFHSCKTFAAKSVKVRAEPNTGPEVLQTGSLPTKTPAQGGNVQFQLKDFWYYFLFPLKSRPIYS